MNRGKASVNFDVNEFCSLQKFWEIGQDTNKISLKTRELALQCLIDILSMNIAIERPFLN